MKAEVYGSPSFGHVHVLLESGEQILSEAGAMASMDTGLTLNAVPVGGLMVSLIRKFLGGETLFVNRFTNSSQTAQKVVLSPNTPGDVTRLSINNETVYFQRGAFLACTPGIKVGVSFAGLRSFLAREGLFRLKVSGQGEVFLSAFGAIESREVDGEYIVDSGHLVSYPANIKLKLRMAGGLFSSVAGGEGLVAVMEGKGKILIQTRTLHGFAGWLNPKLGNRLASAATNQILGKLPGFGG